jgi:hypothetical protein
MLFNDEIHTGDFLVMDIFDIDICIIDTGYHIFPYVDVQWKKYDTKIVAINFYYMAKVTLVNLLIGSAPD